MQINSYQLSQFQRCKRPYKIGQTHTFDKWRPSALLGMCLRYAIFNLSNGGKLEDVSLEATRYFLSQAKSPGLDVVGVDTYSLSMDFLAIIKNVLEYLSRQPLLMLKEIDPVNLTPEISWQFLSNRDSSGVLHKWKFVDYLPDDDGVLAEIHGWEVFGDIAAFDAPMVLHLIAVGKRSGSHQSSPWCRTFAHPKLGKIYRFKKKSSEIGGEGEWRPVYFGGSVENKSKDWVNLMLKENLMPTLIRHVNVGQVPDIQIEKFKKNVLAEAMSMQEIDSMKLDDIPLSRYACDHPYACPHQLFCYNNLTLDNVGIYTPRKKKKGASPDAIHER